VVALAEGVVLVGTPQVNNAVHGNADEPPAWLSSNYMIGDPGRRERDVNSQ
jgi:hypothetical protein